MQPQADKVVEEALTRVDLDGNGISLAEYFRLHGCIINLSLFIR
jgi:hypothetical protein